MNVLRKHRRSAGAPSVACLLLAGIALAAEPKLTHLYPVAGQQGTTVSVTAAGKFDPWPPQVWVDPAGVAFKPTQINGKFDVEIAPDAPPGPRLVRFFNGSGASAPRFFIVSREPERLEVEPNDHFKSPQKIAGLPATISGRLDKSGDVDSFAVTLGRGQTLVARVEAYMLASTFDGMLRIVDTEGTQLAFNHDGCTLDPFLAWEAPRDGTFIVQLMGFVYPATSDVRLTGGEGCVYRLHLTGGPFVRSTLPLAVQRGRKTPVTLVGWNLPSPTAEIDATHCDAQATTTELPLPGVTWEQPLAVSDGPEPLEIEPNNTAANAQPIEVSGGVTGRIDPAGDEDCFCFTAVKQRTYELQVIAARAGSPLDAWLKIENKEGKELARSDDAGASRDPRLTWTAPSDGVFHAVIGDVTHHGGEDFIYRLAIREATASVSGTTAIHSLAVTPGKTGEWKVTVKRANRFGPKLELTAKNLPEGVTAPEVAVPEKDGEVTMKFDVSSEAKPAGQPFEIVLREAETGTEHPVRFFMTTTSENNGVPQGYTALAIDSTERLWLTVLEEPSK